MKTAWRNYSIVACAAILAFLTAISVLSQAIPDVRTLGDQLRLSYDVVALRDGIGLVPRQPKGDIRFIEVRNGAVAINGNMLSAREVSERLGQDAPLILRITYLDAAARQNLVHGDSALPTAQTAIPENAGGFEPEPPAQIPTRRGDMVRFGSNVTVGRGEVVEGDVVAIGGSADVDGEVTQEVTVIGGSLTLGPHAVVRRDVTVVGGTLNRSPDARVYGKVSDVGVGPQVGFVPRVGREFPFWTRLWRVSGLFGTVLRLSLLTLGALAVVALGGQYVETIADRAATESLRAGVTGLLAEVLFVPLLVLTIVILAVSIIGIPLLFLLPFAVVLAVVLMLVGFTGVACQIGRIVGDRFGIRRGRYLSVALGVLVIVSLTLIARIIALLGGIVFGSIIAGSFGAVGYLAEYLAWTIGTGAVILTWLSTRHGRPAPSGPASADGATQAE